MYSLFKDSFFIMIIDEFIQCNEYITKIPDDYYDQIGLLYKTDIYHIFVTMYEESSYLWMSLGLRPDINSKTANKVLSYVNLLPDELIIHITSYIPDINYTLAKKCHNCHKYHMEIKQYFYIRVGKNTYDAKGVDSNFVHCRFQVTNNIDAISRIYEGSVIYNYDNTYNNTRDRDSYISRRVPNDYNIISRNYIAETLSEMTNARTRPVRNTRTQNRFNPYTSILDDELLNVSRNREYLGAIVLPSRRLFNNYNDFVPRRTFINVNDLFHQ